MNASRDQHIDTLVEIVRTSLAAGRFRALTLSKPLSAETTQVALSKVEKILMRPTLVKAQAHVCVVFRCATQDITKNYVPDLAVAQIRLLLQEFANAHLLTDAEDVQLITSRKGNAELRRARTQAATIASLAHNRDKAYSLGLDAPFLAALGITHASAGKMQLVQAMAHKFKQINKFLEIFQSALLKSAAAEIGRLRVVDFGAGKGYLTFAIAHWLRASRPNAAHEVLGVEQRPELVQAGNALCSRLGINELAFVTGDVRNYAPGKLDVMVALHACDTATDYAIRCGIANDAAVILCAPCCHKQLRPQMQVPDSLAPLFKHGVHLGQEADMLTDGLRALLLEAAGYQTQVFEFVASEHTAKNKMILAVRRKEALPAARVSELRAQIQSLKEFYGVREHCLESLMSPELQPVPIHTPDDFRAVFNQIERHIEAKYAIPVVISDVADPFTGDLDGAQIKVDHANSPEDALFIIAHLFGHTVQWNLSESGRTIGNQTPDPNLSRERMRELYQYELAAARYSLALFHEAKVPHFDQWLSDYFHCDWSYLSHFYKTGEKGEFRSFWRDNTRLITPLAIPDFTPKAWTTRWAGIVV
jgi:SAM-dependent methyltransferase